METLMIRPKKSDFLAQARPGQRFAVVHEMPADRVTPVDAFYATGASYLLESAERGMQIGRYSFLGISPDTKIEIRGTRCCVHAGAERREHEAADPLRIVGEYLRERPYIAPGDLSPLPVVRSDISDSIWSLGGSDCAIFRYVLGWACRMRCFSVHGTILFLTT